MEISLPTHLFMWPWMDIHISYCISFQCWRRVGGIIWEETKGLVLVVVLFLRCIFGQRTDDLSSFRRKRKRPLCWYRDELKSHKKRSVELYSITYKEVICNSWFRLTGVLSFRCGFKQNCAQVGSELCILKLWRGRKKKRRATLSVLFCVSEKEEEAQEDIIKILSIAEACTKTHMKICFSAER